jgi:hypothetical protein
VRAVPAVDDAGAGIVAHAAGAHKVSRVGCFLEARRISPNLAGSRHFENLLLALVQEPHGL